MPDQTFQPVSAFDFEINRSERSHQVRWLAPLLAQPEGRVWFLDRLNCPCSQEEAEAAKVSHLCFPLRDLFTADYYRCRGNTEREDQFIAYYNDVFDLPEGFGVQEVWRTAPNGEIRHPAAGGRAGWYEGFLEERVADERLRIRARNVRRMLGTEADVLLLTDNYVTLVECKYKGAPSSEQYDRQQMMGSTFARRLEKNFCFGMVVAGKRDSHFVQIDVPYVQWSEVRERLAEMKGASS